MSLIEFRAHDPQFQWQRILDLKGPLSRYVPFDLIEPPVVSGSFVKTLDPLNVFFCFFFHWENYDSWGIYRESVRSLGILKQFQVYGTSSISYILVGGLVAIF